MRTCYSEVTRHNGGRAGCGAGARRSASGQASTSGAAPLLNGEWSSASWRLRDKGIYALAVDEIGGVCRSSISNEAECHGCPMDAVNDWIATRA